MRCYNLPQYMCGNDASLAPKDLAVSEEYHSRYPLDVVGTRGGWIPIHIDFEYAHLVAHIPREFPDDGRHHLAGSTPVRVKVDEHGLLTLDNVAEPFSPGIHINCVYVPEGTAASVRRNRLLDRIPLKPLATSIRLSYPRALSMEMNTIDRYPLPQ